MSKEPTIDRLSAYLDDELSADEREALERQLAASESLRQQLEELRQVKDWFREYPGRKPRKDAWQGIVARLSALDATDEERARVGSGSHRRRFGGLALIPAFAWLTNPTALKRLGIGALVALAVGGMGRQYVLEQRADDLEQTNVLRDIQLVRYAKAARWSLTAVNLRGEEGRRIQVLCPPGGIPRSIWGTGVYTDDSAICTAGVHSGVITLEDGGSVDIVVLPGLPEYRGTVRNGIESRAFGPWRGSFAVVTEGQPSSALFDEDGGTTTWDATAISYRGLNGSMIRFFCPAGGEPSGVWGSGAYTDDSSVCTAAVHDGIITFSDGGEVIIEIVPGLSEYDGTFRHGVESGDYSEWPGSFVFVPKGEPRPRAIPEPRPRPDPRPNPNPDPHPNPRPNPRPRAAPDVRVALESDVMVDVHVSVSLGLIDWSTNAVEMSAWTGTQTELTCPPNGEAKPVWGTDTYTDGSSICTAAVHAGLITFEDGGDVTIEILPGRSRYPGTRRNGVYTNTFVTSEVWRGSFAFVRN